MTLKMRYPANWNSLNGNLPKLDHKLLNEKNEKPYDSYHPVGTCRMGEDAESVVDKDLKV